MPDAPAAAPPQPQPPVRISLLDKLLGNGGPSNSSNTHSNSISNTGSAGRGNGVASAVDAPVYAEDPAALRARAREFDDVRRRYLGPDAATAAAAAAASAPAKKGPKEGGSKGGGQFLFEWNASDDTSRDSNPLYLHRHAAAPLFGRGAQGGMDPRVQQKQAEAFLEALARRRGQDGAAGGAGGQSAVDAAPYDISMSASASASAVQLQLQRQPQRRAPEQHWSEKPLSAMTERDWRIMREDFDIRVRGGRACDPLRSWAEAAIHPDVRRAIDAAGYVKPSPIQRQAIPMGLSGRDLMGIAETGSGKTAAFLVPLLHWILQSPPEMRASLGERGPLALIMAPTRELAQQIEEEARKLARFSTVRTLAVVGGTSIQDQGYRLREGVDIVVGTPGRLIDVLDQAYLVLLQCRYVVLDEADRMIDMGFEPQVTRVLDAMGGVLKSEKADEAEAQMKAMEAGSGVLYRTTHMFSATMPPQVERLAKRYLRHPATVKIGDDDSGKNRRIAQEVIFVSSEARKRSRLVEVLRSCERPCIVFVNAKKQCDIIGRDLESHGFSCAVLHSGKQQEIREEALADFKAGAFEILIATDVAGRGLDIPNVAHVVNYDMSSDIDRYTHRIGRTGRAGKTGKATTFVTEEDATVLPALKAYLEATGQAVPPEIASRAAAAEQPGRGGQGGQGGGGGKFFQKK
jgi:ATP-dependent RNA helicase DDX23/PRP28